MAPSSLQCVTVQACFPVTPVKMKFPLSSALFFFLASRGASAFPSPPPVVDDFNDTLRELPKRATSFWYANMDHTGPYRGYAPDLDNDYDYPVFKAVSAGDGASIQTAINAGTNAGETRHGQWLASQPRVGYSLECCDPEDWRHTLTGPRSLRWCTSRPERTQLTRLST